MQIKIDPEFKALAPPLSTEERQGLERSIVEAGEEGSQRERQREARRRERQRGRGIEEPMMNEPVQIGPDVKLFVGDVLDVLPTLPAESVHCCITSPPYWSLRDYGTATWEGGDEGCDHRSDSRTGNSKRQERNAVRNDAEEVFAHPSSWGDGGRQESGVFHTTCGKCGARRIDSQLGLEATPDEFVAKLVKVFREVRRILRSDATVFLNLGDSYSAVEYGRIRNHEKETFFRLPMGTRRQVFVLWRACLGGSVPRDVRDLLSEAVESQEPDTNEAVRKAVLRDEQGGVLEQDCCSQQETANGDDSDAGGEVCLLRRNGAGVPLSGSHQGRREARVSEEGRVERRVEKSDPRGVATGQVSNSMLELQRRAWALWQVSTLELDLSDVPREARGLFDVTLKPKDLCGIPWRVAFALQADGWYLRQDIIWAKPNPMPESVTDRCTKAHEYLFLLSKSPRYYYDADAVRVPHKGEHAFGAGVSLPGYEGRKRAESCDGSPGNRPPMTMTTLNFNPLGRNRHSVWTIATQAYPECHFATFPEKLVEPCILAGTSAKGCCPECGTPWKRVVERTGGSIGKSWTDHKADAIVGRGGGSHSAVDSARSETGEAYQRSTTGWQPTCECGRDETTPCVVLDPFLGSGTTLAVAARHGCKGVGIELSPEYAELAVKRIGREVDQLKLPLGGSV